MAPSAVLSGPVIEGKRALMGEKPETSSPKRTRFSPRVKKNGLTTPTSPGSVQQADALVSLLYSTSLTTKIWGVAEQGMPSLTPPTLFPEYTMPGGTKYVYRELDFWTSGFFPGCLYLLLERRQKYAHRLSQLRSGDDAGDEPHRLHLEFACKWWTETLHANAKLTYTHDLGFMISPWASLAWDMHRDARAYQTMLTAASSLYNRYDENVGCIKSWDFCITKRYSFTKPEDGFLVIIDNMMNLDLIFWAAKELGDQKMHAAAKKHAETTRAYHINPEDNSTCHVVIFEPDTGAFRARITNQGFSDTSAWTRGQAWAIAGFAQTYDWTRDVSFLETAMACADFFLRELLASKIPPWDFRAPEEPGKTKPTDTSAGVVAAYGMLLIHEALLGLGREDARNWLDEALDIVRAIGMKHTNGPGTYRKKQRSVQTVEHGEVVTDVGLEVDMGDECETILNGATINNYEFAPRRWANHGLVYADYYFLLFGNKLLEMGLDARLAGLV
ncbi:unsaturated glucuronyl hydrolase [Plectosphaerella plurivora]|uniref:Unsaturated glucuronyl hydrolase n=1 Tax=Plectosphaerella plurivora TaxID=936078 RepID=A0A9P8VIF1_9PEZI|nr:unsaturated glucuronyl hydrolase [Plectosphaerella plurivora]